MCISTPYFLISRQFGGKQSAKQVCNNQVKNLERGRIKTYL